MTVEEINDRIRQGSGACYLNDVPCYAGLLRWISMSGLQQYPTMTRATRFIREGLNTADDT